jgi:pimeloyl-ACP methyl ester carboxylesterase
MPAREHAVEVSGGRTLRVLEDGDPAGVPCIVHHGTPGSRLLPSWWVDDAAERGIRLIGFDRAGYGGSDPRPGRRVADVAEDVAALADALGIERFVTHGGSGGGPHSLACAALLEDRVAAAATLAGVAPWRAEGLDWLAGMGEDNVREFGAALEGREGLAAQVEEIAAEMLQGTPEALVSAMRTLLSPPDLAVFTGRLAEEAVQDTREAISKRRDGWVDDDLAFTRPWGFELADIAVPVLLWHGRQDRFVPPAHGEWLAGQIPGVDARISDEDGHVTLAVTRIGDVHAWLLERY